MPRNDSSQLPVAALLELLTHPCGFYSQYLPLHNQVKNTVVFLAVSPRLVGSTHLFVMSPRNIFLDRSEELDILEGSLGDMM